jgi:uncharacterized caspase-like protein
MKSAINLLTFLAVAGGIYFGYKWFKSSDIASAPGTTYAVIVGVSDYKYLLPPSPANRRPPFDLNYCDDDARLVYDFFRSPEGGSVPAENMVLLIDKQASAANVIGQMRKLFRRSTSKDRIIFYFSGHGSDGVFCPYDYNQSTALSKGVIAQVFRESHARTRFLFGDACHAGSMLKNAASTRAVPDSDNKIEDEQAGFAGFMASRSDQVSGEDSNPNGTHHGFFTNYFVEGAKGKADKDNNRIVTISELYAYVRSNLIRKTNGQQVPVTLGKFSDKMAFSYLP